MGIFLRDFNPMTGWERVYLLGTGDCSVNYIYNNLTPMQDFGPKSGTHH